MEINPRYDGVPVIDVEGDPRTSFLRQHHRLRAMFGSLTDEEWRTASRCDGWSVQDVASHLTTVNRFWAASIDAGLRGEPTTFLVGFDAKATPALLVDADRAKSPQEAFDEHVDAGDALCAAVERISDLDTIAEAPPGHISVRALLHHALWDSWVHERDVGLPLGRTPAVEDDEVLASLRYVAGLGPAFSVTLGTATADVLVLRTPRTSIVVEVSSDQVRVHDGDAPDGALVIEGDAVDLLEGLSVRQPLTVDVPTDRRWLVTTLSDVFS